MPGRFLATLYDTYPLPSYEKEKLILSGKAYSQPYDEIFT